MTWPDLTPNGGRKMKTIKARFTLSIGFVGAKHEDIVEIQVEEDATKEEIEEEINEEWERWAMNYIDGGAEIIEEDEEG